MATSEQEKRNKRYTNLMGEVKFRLVHIDKLSGAFVSVNGKMHGDNVFVYENMCLQLRKVLELIAFSTLVANQQKIEDVLENYDSFWRASKFLKKIEQVNPFFFPTPARFDGLNPGGLPRIESEPDPEAFSLGEFAAVYDACSEVIHVTNPFSTKPITPLGRPFPTWVQRIRNLLRLHLVYLSRDELQLVDMLDWNDGMVSIARLTTLTG